MDERITRYDHLYKMMAEGSDPEKMRIFGHAERHMFRVIVERNSALADEWLAMLEGVEYNNYLTEEETKEIGEHMENQDGTMGYHWPCAVLLPAVESLGGTIEEKPYYNSYALWVVMNMIWSDHAKSIAEDMGYKSVSDVPADRMVKSCYRKAIEKLRDPDREDFVRDYFRHAMYDDSPM